MRFATSRSQSLRVCEFGYQYSTVEPRHTNCGYIVTLPIHRPRLYPADCHDIPDKYARVFNTFCRLAPHRTSWSGSDENSSELVWLLTLHAFRKFVDSPTEGWIGSMYNLSKSGLWQLHSCGLARSGMGSGHENHL